MNKSGFVLAGFETLSNITDNFIKNTKGRYNNNFTREDISNFFSKTCSGFLHSYGQTFAGKRNYSKHSKIEAQLFQNCRSTGFFDNSEFFVDSGGFQVSIGKLSRDEAILLSKMYYEFLEKYYEVYDRAFILDVPPGPGCEIFHNFEDVYKWNLSSYTIAANMPKYVKDKIIYIHHFRTPKLWEMFMKILKDYDMFSNFNYHGAGGMTANLSSDVSIPCVVYVLPLTPLLNECKKINRSYLHFHILGIATFRDIFFYELFQKHVKKKHGIDLIITYDSAVIYKGLMTGRSLYIRDDNVMRKVDIKSLQLNRPFKNGLKVADVYKNSLAKLSNKYGFKIVGGDGIYNDKTGTFFEEIKVYTMMYVLDQFLEVQNMFRELVEIVYPMYESGNVEDFTREIIHITRDLNNRKITKKQRVKAISIVKSLDMLTNLDEDHCEYVIKRSLGKDEFSELDSERRGMTI